MMFYQDLSGQQFGKLRVLEFVERKQKHSYWECLCQCGNKAVVRANQLKTGRTKSCGCMKMDALLRRNLKHGKRHTVEYHTWLHMKDRCFNPNSEFFRHYGGRGITVCKSWATSFENFLADMGQKPSPDLSIDRIDVNGNYEPGNCRWATKQQQRLNQRRKN